MTETNRIEFKRELTRDLDIEKEVVAFLNYHRNKELMRVFRDVDMVESLGSGMKRILQVYPKRIFIFMDDFIRLTIPFYSQKGSKVVQGNSTSSKKYSTSSRQNSTSSKKAIFACILRYSAYTWRDDALYEYA